jgi:AAA15 family ATPase/GTPase
MSRAPQRGGFGAESIAKSLREANKARENRQLKIAKGCYEHFPRDIVTDVYMLVSFSVSNFRSFDEEQTFSLVASKRHSGEHKDHALSIPDSDELVLRTGLIYGANGAGKSNLFKALQFLKKIALGSRQKEALLDRVPFLLRSGNRPSVFDLQFIYGETLFRYCVKVDDFTIIEESLTRVINGNERIVYERLTSPEGRVDVRLGETEANDEQLTKIKALATIGGPQNQSFLATALVTLDKCPSLLFGPMLWFATQLTLLDPNHAAPGFMGPFATDPDLLRFASGFLNAASTGIDHLAATESQISEEEAAQHLNSRFRERLAAGNDRKPTRHVLNNGDVIVTSKSGEDLKHTLIQVKATHRNLEGDAIPFDINQESDGTQRLLQLVPALHSMHRHPRCYFIDEIDRSLHPILVHDFVEFFLRSCTGKNAQLVMTTHESTLLDQDLLRRDEIWFAEKNREGATTLYSLLDFNPRNDMQLRKNYLQGRFGAVPFLGGIERLLEKEGSPQ